MQRLVVETQQINGATLWLTPEQQHYLNRVLRLKQSDRFLALDGKGSLWLATLTADGEQAILAPAPQLAEPASALKPPITLAASLPKQGFDEVVRQVTELGVDIIVPIVSDRTLLRPSPSKLERWRRITMEAAEQSERLTVPVIREPITWQNWIAETTPNQRFLCVTRIAAPSLMSFALTLVLDGIEVAIGPEGGWTDQEAENAIAAGYQPVTLGKPILRAVTAPITALSILQAASEFANMYPHQVK